ncbi:LAMI_0H04632g1_1 [Lachancea mirantina]|uniref:LAMI_0H04632g1_1 n=1 Tax=Lachancea mirantina TaxID=1230905 RepID=A0A1G4KEV4_9SACH|nr:LAMI_0H04632g1_1 [Lachancea mirantina]
MSLQKLIQNHYLVVQLRLLYRGDSLVNELALQRALVSRLNTLGSVLYASSNAKSWQHTLQRNPPKLDLVISTSDLPVLASIVLNLRGFGGTFDAKSAPLAPDGITEINQKPQLRSAYNDLRRGWALNERRRKVRSREVRSFTVLEPWVFASTPSETVATTDNDTVTLALENASDTVAVDQEHDFRGSRFFKFDRWQPANNKITSSNSIGSPSDPTKRLPQLKDAFYDEIGLLRPLDRRYVCLEPRLYKDFGALPKGLSQWFEGLAQGNFDLTATEQDKLGILLKGFKGFST